MQATRGGLTRLLAVWLLGAVVGGPAATPAAAAEPPRRIVSLNLCTDQILLDLVPPGRIRALSHLAADPLVSASYERARGIRATRGAAEEVLGLDPDLVVAGTFSTPATVSLLERLGRPVLKVPLASDIPQTRSAVRLIAAAVGEAGRGEALLAELDRRISAAAPPQGARAPTAVVYQVNNLASGPGSLADAVLKAAGFANHAAVLGLGAGGQLPLEALIARPPDLLVLSGPVDEYRTAVAGNLRHPALAALMHDRATLVLPWRLWLCGTPHIAEAVERLAEKRRALAP